ncbi:MAG: insulinase family protein [Bdellovibrionales bacterium]|nr:insulinase family protein [Bdellovibrionales bacterium]
MRVLIGFILLITSCSTLHTSNLSNGTPLSSHMDKGLPRQILTLQFSGLVNQLARDEQAFFPVISKVFDTGPTGMTEEEYKQKLFLLNASISFNPAYRTFDVSIVSPPQHFEETLNLAFQVLRSPKLDPKNVTEAILNTKSNLQSSFSSMRTGLMYHAFKDYFKNDSLSLNGTTSPKDVSKMNKSNVVSLYKKIFTLEHVRAYSVGPIEASSVASSLNAMLTKYQVPTYTPYVFNKEIASPSPKVQIIHRPNVTDHQVLFLFHHKFDIGGKEGVVAQTMFDYFGGGLTGKLGMILREERGLTYHASANYGRYLPSWYIYSFAGSKQLESLLKGIVEVKKLTEESKVTTQELYNIKSSLVADFKQSYELPMDDLGLEAYADLFSFSVRSLRNFPDEVMTVSTSDLESYKASILSNKDFALYIMGDKNVIIPILQRLGYKKVEVINETNL